MYNDGMNDVYVGKRHGFTIVELLIVIVIIGILAAITIVAYNGISERARLAAATQYDSSLKDRYLSDAVGYWNFDECSGSKVTNTASNAPTPSSSITGTATWSTDTPTGSGCSLSFNGSTSIDTGVTLSNTFYSKSAWIKSTSSNSAQNILSDSSSSSSDDAFFLANGYAAAGHNSNWYYVSYPPVLNDGKWHFVGVTFTQNANGTSGTMVLTVDGKTVSTNPNVPLMANAAATDQAIGDFGGGSYFVGLIDDVMVVTQ